LHSKKELQEEKISCHHSITTNPNVSFALHCHSFYEIYYFLSGRVQYRVEGKLFLPEPNSLLLIPAKAFHGVRVESDEPYERYALHFLPEILPKEEEELLLAPFHSGRIHVRLREPLRFRQYCDSLLQCGDFHGPLRQVAVRCRLEALLTQLAVVCGSAAPGGEGEGAHSAEEILQYINEHLSEPLPLQGIADHFFISKNHLNRVFQSATGTTVGNYINFKRSVLAQQLLLEGQSATEAALNAGFRDYSTFYRSYRRIFGYGPAETRERLLHLEIPGAERALS
jgi:AraC-like DNA-binding protein/mannose-6-phosphate isomerase-like protein (cupin superfamily)